MIYTSYYAKVRKLPAGVEGISISVGVPRWWQGKHYPALAPRREWIDLPPDQYDPLFAALLAQLDPAVVYRELLALAAPNVPAVLCYEANPEECHRSAVRRWWIGAGLESVEFGTTPSLFD
jgi:hypothetical protein